MLQKKFFFWDFTGSTNVYGVIPKAQLWQIRYINFPKNDAGCSVLLVQ